MSDAIGPDEPPDGLGFEELVRKAGVELEEARQLVAAGLIDRNIASNQQDSSITKLRLMGALIEAGVDLDHLAQAVADGRLSFEYVDVLMPEQVPLVQVGDNAPLMDQEGRDIVQTLLGSDLDRPTIREDDLELINIVARARELGAPIENIWRIVRATALSAQHLVALQREFIDDVLLSPAMRNTSPTAALAETAKPRFEFRQLGRRLVSLLVERHVDAEVFKNIVELTELSLGRSGIGSLHDDQAVAFVDISSYTRLAREVGDKTAAEQAVLLTDIAQRSASIHGGRLVKSLGDGAFAHFPHSTSALSFALDLVNNAERHGLWTLHSGVNAGTMLRRDGDYYGTAVNIASRLADTAAPGQVLVTRQIVDTWQGDTVTFKSLGRIQVKNIDEGVEVFDASLASPSSSARVELDTSGSGVT